MNDVGQADALFQRATAPSGDRPYVAYCFENGAIFFGFKVPSGGREIVRGRRDDVRSQIELRARPTAGAPKVPGMPEAASSEEALAAFTTWISHCARNSLPGLAWSVPRAVERRS